MLELIISIGYFLGIGYTIEDYSSVNGNYVNDFKSRLGLVIYISFVFLYSPVFLLIDLGRLLYKLNSKEDDK
jgi:hypothetical protein